MSVPAPEELTRTQKFLQLIQSITGSNGTKFTWPEVAVLDKEAQKTLILEHYRKARWVAVCSTIITVAALWFWHL